MKKGSCFIYNLATKELKETDKVTFLRTLLVSTTILSDTGKSAAYDVLSKKSYEEIIKSITLNKLAAGIFGIRADNNRYFFILLDKTKETLEKFIKNKVVNASIKLWYHKDTLSNHIVDNQAEINNTLSADTIVLELDSGKTFNCIAKTNVGKKDVNNGIAQRITTFKEKIYTIQKTPYFLKLSYNNMGGIFELEWKIVDKGGKFVDIFSNEMSKEEALKEYKELNKKAREAQKAYYNEQPIMQDKEYDIIYDRIVELENKYGFDDKNSVTKTAGVSVKVSKGQKVKHEFPCLSQDKTKDRNELLRWLGDQEGVLSNKEDGGTIVLTYDGGSLTQVATRGDGTIGQNVTEFGKTQNCFPKTIPDKGHVVVRGEYIFTYTEFDRLNNLGGQVFTHPRNLANGNCNTLDMNIAKSRQGQFHVFELVKCTNFDKLKSYEHQLKYCKALGFEVVDYKIVDKNNLLDEIQKFENNVSKLDHPTDGLVLRFNDNAYCDKLGYDGHAPKFSIAFKWKDDTYKTVLRDIVWQTSRTGRVNPVAVFDKVDLDGAMTTKATLNNISFIKKLQLGIGDTIEVYRANKVIPAVLCSIDKSNNIKMPTKCPSCGAKLTLKNDGIAEFLYCENPNCSTKRIKSLLKFAEKDAMNFENISEATIEAMVEKGLLKTFSDFYNLENHKKELFEIDGFREKSYQNMVKVINASKNIEAWRFLYSLGIDNIGHHASKDICKYFNDDMQKVINANAEDLENINGIGPTLINSFITYFVKTENRKEVDKLLKIITIKKPIQQKASGGLKLNGKSFCVTGALNSMKRDKFVEMVEANGGIFKSSVGKGLNYLVNNDSQSKSNKNIKAQQLGVAIITEEDFLSMIK